MVAVLPLVVSLLFGLLHSQQLFLTPRDERSKTEEEAIAAAHAGTLATRIYIYPQARRYASRLARDDCVFGNRAEGSRSRGF
jgi:hypothetical protein